MRADRLLSILLLLQVHRRMTAGDLARRLEVSPRTIHRDMEALSAAGVPVHAERGAGGGWVLPDGFRTDVTGLTYVEARALLLAPPARMLADLGLERASGAALVKLIAALPVSMRRDARHLRDRIHIDAAGWRRGTDAVPYLAVLQEAVWQDRQVLLRYRREGREPTERIVDPLGLVAKGNLWYLVAAIAGEPRSYRVSRVENVTLLDTPSARPAGFDLAAYWHASSAAFVADLPRYRCTVRIAPDEASHLWIPGSYAQIERVGAPEADGWLTVDLTMQSEAEACRYALGFGAAMEVLAPPALRERVQRTANEIVNAYTMRASAACPAVPAGAGG